MIDVTAFCGPWPFRPLPAETPAQLEKLLAANGITEALVSPIEGAFYDEPHLANERLFRQLRGRTSLHPVAILHPGLASWRKSLEAALERYGIKAVRLLPAYHLYDLAQGDAPALLEEAGARKLPVILQLRLQDRRTQHRRAPVPDVDLASALAAVEAHPATRFVLSGIRWGELKPAAAKLKGIPNLWIDLSGVEYTDILRSVIELYGERLLFGTHTPFYVTASSILKLEEAGLSAKERKAITEANARKLFRL